MGYGRQPVAESCNSALFNFRIGIASSNSRVSKPKIEKQRRDQTSINAENVDEYGFIRTSLERKAELYDALVASSYSEFVNDPCIDFSKKANNVLELDSVPARSNVNKKGVGYYPFASDESAKDKQLETLANLHSRAVLSRTIFSINRSRLEIDKNLRLERCKKRLDLLKKTTRTL